MKIKIEYDMPDERGELDYALDGYKYQVVLQDIDNYLRKILKYDDSISDKEYDIYEEIREKIYNIAEENNILIWD